MKKLFLIGNPVEHSISPQMQNAALRYMGLDCEYSAVLVKDAEDLKKKTEEFRSSDVLGFNVTVPFKEQVIGFLDSIDASSKLIGAVNTVKNVDGKLHGCNTDVIGFTDSLREDAHFKPKEKKCLVLGAGGASRALVFGLNYEKAEKVFIYDIDPKKAAKLVLDMSRYFNNLVQTIDKKDLNRTVETCDLIVNATPVGMFPKTGECPLEDDAPMSSKHTVYDLVYNPSETRLVQLARSKASKAVSGLGMLVRQGAASFVVWTGKNAPYKIMLMNARKALGF